MCLTCSFRWWPCPCSSAPMSSPMAVRSSHPFQLTHACAARTHTRMAPACLVKMTSTQTPH
ncbi:hypothetical protein EJB05_45057, partial [Eragrostis curvula]